MVVFVRFSTRSKNWEGSTTVVYTVVWRNPVVWWGGGTTALWLVTKCVFVCAQYELPGDGFLFSQSQRRISPSPSNHGISPNDSV